MSKKDLEFLIELKDNVINGKHDLPSYEMALKMIDDWIDELKNKERRYIEAQCDNCGEYIEVDCGY